MNDQLAPIAIFTYKRLNTLKKTLDSLSDNPLAKKSSLFIFSDGPKNEKDSEAIAKVRDYLKTIEGFENITFHFSDKNQGLAKSIITGVSRILETVDSVIVLEDDLILTTNFLQFMNDGLAAYSDQKEIFSISGYSFDLKIPPAYAYDAYFLNRGWSWGWATWADRWKDVDWEVKDYEQFRDNAKLKREFNRGGSDLSTMLEKQIAGKLDSWAIRWFYSQFKNKGFTLYPVYSKVLNIGFDEMATHTTGSNKRYLPKIDQTLKNEFKFPPFADTASSFQVEFQKKMGIMARITSKLGSYVKYIFK